MSQSSGKKPNRNNFSNSKPSNSSRNQKSDVKKNGLPPKKWDKKPVKSTPVSSKNPNEIRLNKYIANSGMCSRREADIYISSGNVRVNGEVIVELGKVIQITDQVHFDGVLITPGKKEYILLNKPKGFSTAEDLEAGHRNVRELIKSAGTHLQPVGRMDKNTTGLLLFTNDTDIFRKFTIPQQKDGKLYQVSLDKNLKYEDLEKIQAGLTIDGHRVSVQEISYVENEAKSEIGIKIKSPNIKIVRHIFEHLNYDVLRIDRVTFAGLTKWNLPRGNWRYLTEQEIINIKNM